MIESVRMKLSLSLVLASGQCRYYSTGFVIRHTNSTRLTFDRRPSLVVLLLQLAERHLVDCIDNTQGVFFIRKTWCVVVMIIGIFY